MIYLIGSEPITVAAACQCDFGDLSSAIRNVPMFSALEVSP